ncbi:MAG: DEAD/DEAH box helicase family protein [Synergistaceae bacterium]|nr:DEAD/DEAH box helicase family protein [Synergistaceae bacterium]
MTIRLRFRHQDFQQRAAESVCSIFSGQPFSSMQDTYSLEGEQIVIPEILSMWGNSALALSDDELLANLQAVQKDNALEESSSLDGHSFTVEMETGTGKTYTYIKTIYELNRLYGWSKFVVVVPSIAIREGVYKTFAVTEEHFMQDYHKRADYFIYNSANLSRIRQFAADSGISVMIINSQAFNARDADTRRITQEIDQFGSTRPIDAIAAVHPIMIIDEPQSVEGERTKESLKKFAPLFTLRYSATPRDYYNLVYRLDALDAYSRHIVKSISVTGISVGNFSASGGYVYLKGIIKSEHDPVALVEHDAMTASGLRRVTRNLKEGMNLYELSGGLEEYKGGYILKTIDGLNMNIEFLNGLKVGAGEISGSDDEEQIRRVQIRETIEAHLRKERMLFSRGIKVLSLFFIDKVDKYRVYADDEAVNGVYAKMFEEEYAEAVRNFEAGLFDESYAGYLGSITADKTHAGYFSVDKKNHITDSAKKDGTSDDVSAFDLIMKDRERLLSLGEPVRFIFSHSALREGWDNPNVFQICALRNSSSDIRKRQEVGRGLRLCVNQNGERIDSDFAGRESEEINELTVIAGESYAEFAGGLQQEFSEVLKGRAGEIKIVDSRSKGREIRLNRERWESPEFQGMLRKINHRSVYRVDFTDEELVSASVKAIDEHLNISRKIISIERGGMIADKEGVKFVKEGSRAVRAESHGGIVKYDVVGRLAGITGLTRRVIVKILKGIAREKLAMFRTNPEIFIAETSRLISEQKDAVSVGKISYTLFDEGYSKIFDECITGFDADLAATPKHGLYDYVVCDSGVEKRFACDLDASDDAEVHVKLPSGFSIPTPGGRYNPDWAIAFKDGTYFVAETKGSDSDSQLRLSESAKIACAKEYFRAAGVKYERVSNFGQVINCVIG